MHEIREELQRAIIHVDRLMDARGVERCRLGLELVRMISDAEARLREIEESEAAQDDAGDPAE